LKHDWLAKEALQGDTQLDSVVLKRMRQFAQMNKLKKMCLMVVGQHLSLEEIAGGCFLCVWVGWHVGECRYGCGCGWVGASWWWASTCRWWRLQVGLWVWFCGCGWVGLGGWRPVAASSMTMTPQICCLNSAGMRELFKSIDEDKSGTITVAEMRNSLSHWGHKISEVRVGGGQRASRLHTAIGVERSRG